MLISIKIPRNSAFFSDSDKPRMLFFLLINVKMPTIVGILTFMSRKNFMFNWVEHEKSFITSGPAFSLAWWFMHVRLEITQVKARGSREWLLRRCSRGSSKAIEKLIQWPTEKADKQSNTVIMNHNGSNNLERLMNTTGGAEIKLVLRQSNHSLVSARIYKQPHLSFWKDSYT